MRGWQVGGGAQCRGVGEDLGRRDGQSHSQGGDAGEEQEEACPQWPVGGREVALEVSA